MAIKKTAKTKPRTDAVNSVGPLGGLAAGVIAGVNMSPTTPAPAPNSAITMPPAMTAAFTPKLTTPTTSSLASVGPLGGLQAGVIAGVQAPTGYTETGQPITQPVVTTPVKPAIEKDIAPETRDAFEDLGMTLKGWGLEELATVYTQLMVEGKTAAQALTILKYSKEINPATGLPYNAEYTKRFAGNAARIAGGMNAYDERTYIAVENTYEETLRLNGLGNMISTDRAVNQAKYADYMAKGIAPTEFEKRIELVSERVMNMDPNTKAQFKAYYPSLTDIDLVSYFLNPKETLPILKNKVTAAEIGAVAGTAKYGIGEARAMDLAQFGVTRATALTGYQEVAEAVPTGTKLSNIYAEEGIQYGQTAAEDEFLKQDAQAKLKRNRLASKERATFEGSAGNAPGAYSTSYLKRSSAAGQI
jgi:hypothetical protein